MIIDTQLLDTIAAWLAPLFQARALVANFVEVEFSQSFLPLFRVVEKVHAGVTPHLPECRRVDLPEHMLPVGELVTRLDSKAGIARKPRDGGSIEISVYAKPVDSGFPPPNKLKALVKRYPLRLYGVIHMTIGLKKVYRVDHVEVLDNHLEHAGGKSLDRRTGRVGGILTDRGLYDPTRNSC